MGWMARISIVMKMITGFTALQDESNVEHFSFLTSRKKVMKSISNVTSFCNDYHFKGPERDKSYIKLMNFQNLSVDI